MQRNPFWRFLNLVAGNTGCVVRQYYDEADARQRTEASAERGFRRSVLRDTISAENSARIQIMQRLFGSGQLEMFSDGDVTRIRIKEGIDKSAVDFPPQLMEIRDRLRSQTSVPFNEFLEKVKEGLSIDVSDQLDMLEAAYQGHTRSWAESPEHSGTLMVKAPVTASIQSAFSILRERAKVDVECPEILMFAGDTIESVWREIQRDPSDPYHELESTTEMTAMIAFRKYMMARFVLESCMSVSILLYDPGTADDMGYNKEHARYLWTECVVRYGSSRLHDSTFVPDITSDPSKIYDWVDRSVEMVYNWVQEVGLPKYVPDTVVSGFDGDRAETMLENLTYACSFVDRGTIVLWDDNDADVVYIQMSDDALAYIGPVVGGVRLIRDLTQFMKCSRTDGRFVFTGEIVYQKVRDKQRVWYSRRVQGDGIVELNVSLKECVDCVDVVVNQDIYERAQCFYELVGSYSVELQKVSHTYVLLPAILRNSDGEVVMKDFNPEGVVVASRTVFFCCDTWLSLCKKVCNSTIDILGRSNHRVRGGGDCENEIDEHHILYFGVDIMCAWKKSDAYWASMVRKSKADRCSVMSNFARFVANEINISDLVSGKRYAPVKRMNELYQIRNSMGCWFLNFFSRG